MANTKLKLYFRDNSEISKQLSVDYVRDDYNEAELGAAMDEIIASNVLVTKNGPVKTKYKAELETVERTPLNI